MFKSSLILLKLREVKNFDGVDKSQLTVHKVVKFGSLSDKELYQGTDAKSAIPYNHRVLYDSE